MFWLDLHITCEGGERKPARVFSVKPARKMISNIDYPIISHLSNMPTFFWAKTRQIRGADTPRGRTWKRSRPKADQMAHGVVCHFDLPHMAQKVADWTRGEGRPRADEMAHGAVCRFELPHVAENNRRVTRVDSSLWPQRTVPKLPSGTNGCQTLKTATLNTSYFCQKRPLCQPPPSPTPPPNSHFVRKVKLRLAYRLAFVTV